ncbi:MAG: class I SAM-dependent methyltransferase [Proteobacteria bacterium]|nr:class I SAM-dependent methyltransferase [Pseudomonadota bacterium]
MGGIAVYTTRPLSPSLRVPDISSLAIELSHSNFGAETPFQLSVAFDVHAPIAFDIDVSIDIFTADGTQVGHSQMRAQGWHAWWLPRGKYAAYAMAPALDLPSGNYRVQVALWAKIDDAETRIADAALRLDVTDGVGNGPSLSWQLRSRDGAIDVARLPWQNGGDWFYKHFDHAASTTADYLLGNSPLLKGRILDVGCGDGITDLGIALRKRPAEIVGIDPFGGFARLPEVLRHAQLPVDCIPSCLRFLDASANDIPFADDTFDVVVSWGSLEHIAGGYAKAFSEIRRVLRPGGLLMVHPGLYYSDIGNHLNEFRFSKAEPYVHLKRSREWLREQVMKGEVERMDRAGGDATPEQYWQFFTELNPITVGAFEKELRALDFEPWRVALRTHERVDYTPELQPYSFVDLAVGELYVSAYNRKPAAAR